MTILLRVVVIVLLARVGSSFCEALDSAALKTHAAFRRDAIRRFEQVAGPFKQSNLPLDAKLLSEETLVDGVVRKKIAYHTDRADEPISAFMLLPAGLKAGEKRPGVIVFHSTQPAGKDQPAGLAGGEELHIALHLAKRGYVAIAPDYPSFGEYEHDFANDGYDSGVMQAICNNIRTIDLLCEQPEVDPQHLGAIGHSLGGHTAIFTAIYDERLKAVVSNCGFTSFPRYYGGNLAGWTGERYFPRIATRFGKNPRLMPFDFSDLISALSPRAFLASSPLHDDNFDVVGVQETIAAARSSYERLGSSSKLKAHYPNCGHAFPLEARNISYEFLDEQLEHRPK